MVLFSASYIALPLFDVALDDFALEEDFFVEELDFALLLLDFLTALLDTGSSGSALLPLSPPHDARRKTQNIIAREIIRLHFVSLRMVPKPLFFIQSSPRNKLRYLA